MAYLVIITFHLFVRSAVFYFAITPFIYSNQIISYNTVTKENAYKNENAIDTDITTICNFTTYKLRFKKNESIVSITNKIKNDTNHNRSIHKNTVMVNHLKFKLLRITNTDSYRTEFLLFPPKQQYYYSFVYENLGEPYHFAITDIDNNGSSELIMYNNTGTANTLNFTMVEFDKAKILKCIVDGETPFNSLKHELALDETLTIDSVNHKIITKRWFLNQKTNKADDKKWVINEFVKKGNKLIVSKAYSNSK